MASLYNLVLVETHGFLVQFGALLAWRESLDFQVLPRLHESFRTLRQSVVLIRFLASLERFLGDNFSRLVFHQCILCLSGGLHFGSCSPPNLSAGSSDGDTSGLASAADDFLLSGGSALAGDPAGGSSSRTTTGSAARSATSSHFVFLF